MSTKRFIAKHGLDNNNLTIINVADPVNSSDAVNKGVTDIIYLRANSAYDLAQNAYDKANTGGGSGTDEYARETANSASANTVYTQGVDESQNTNITIAINLAQAAFDYANTINVLTNLDFGYVFDPVGPFDVNLDMGSL